MSRTLALIALGSSLPAPAQSQGWSWSPSVAAWERNDDNLFAGSEVREQDWITGLEPALLVAHAQARWSLEAGYSQAAERYRWHPQLDSNDARRAGSLAWEARVTHTLETSLTASYLRTSSAGELYRTSGLDLGRLSAQRLQLTPAVGWRLSPVTALDAELALTRDELQGSGALDSAVVGVRLERELSGRARLFARAQARRYEPSSGAGVLSQLLALGGRRGFGRALELTLEVGPRFSRGTVAAEWSGTLRSRGRRGEWTITWEQGEAAVPGTPEPVVTRRLGASALQSRGRLAGRFGLEFLQNIRGLDGRAVQALGEARWRLAEGWALQLGTAWSRQQRESPASNSDAVRHTVTELRFVVAPGRQRENSHAR